MKNYKFKSLKVFGSDEWLANRKREYRSVFDESELTYLSAEFAFYNKRFDEKEWDAQISLRAYSLKGEERTEVCVQDETRKVLPAENIVYVNKGWGMAAAGAFWKAGEYLWEALIDGEVVGTKRFYIENAGKVWAGNNPYFDIRKIRFFTGDFNAVNDPNKVYLKQINRDTAPYLYIEFTAENKLNYAWNCEIVFNWYNASGLLKARIERYRKINAVEPEPMIVFTEGWGNDMPGTWRDSAYRLEVVFMDSVIAVLQLPTGEVDVEGEIDAVETPHAYVSAASAPEENDVNVEQLLAKFNNLVGMESLRREIHDHLDYIRFLKVRKEKGLQDEERINLHAVFTGNPGTGKTTVVKMLGQIYKSMGLLSKGHVREVDRSHLIGEYIGQTAPKVKKVIEEAQGGILFIDEAYSLAREGDDSKDFGKEALEILVREMSDGNPDIAIMVAGYPKEMEVFLSSNPGLKSRFGNYFHFEDYTPEELLEIVLKHAAEKQVTLTEKAQNYLYEQLIEGFRTRDRSFGNARYAIGLLSEAKMNMGLRLIKQENFKDFTAEEISTIQKEDIERIFEQKDKKKVHLKVNEKLLQSALNDLDKLIGINNIKNEVNELIRLVRFYNETGKDVLNKFSLHTVFLGNPGTGKTTVARVFGKLFKALGLLERGHLVELDKQGLISGYVGQTAGKTADRIQEAKGGVLFIDEAYSLMDGAQGQEAIEILLKRMEDMRGEISVIVAGYTEPMKRLLESNPGLKSRFDRTFLFEDYSETELVSIALNMFIEEKVKMNPEAEEAFKKHVHALYESRDKYFGNARVMRKLVQEVVHQQNLRLASLPKEARTREMLETITVDDLKELQEADALKRKGLGFRY